MILTPFQRTAINVVLARRRTPDDTFEVWTWRKPDTGRRWYLIRHYNEHGWYRKCWLYPVEQGSDPAAGILAIRQHITKWQAEHANTEN